MVYEFYLAMNGVIKECSLQKFNQINTFKPIYNGYDIWYNTQHLPKFTPDTINIYNKKCK